MRPRLLFTYIQHSPFIEEDIRLLSERYDVRVFRFSDPGRGGLQGLVRSWRRQQAWLADELPGAVGIFGWFADYHLALPVRAAQKLRKPVVVALGGFDCNHLPEYGYGVFDSRWRAPLARYVFRGATLLLPVTGALVYSENQYASWPERRADGLRVHVPDLRTPVRPLPTGYDPEQWPEGPALRPPVVCTVAFVASERSFRIKGLDVLVEAARQLPEVSVQVVGVTPAMAAHIQREVRPSRNVVLLPPRPRHELAPVYAGASVYAQLSRTEGLPNVVCEAMLCGCIPVGSAVAGIPEAIGEAGFVVDTPEPEGVVAALRQALAAEPAARARARARIVEQFSMARRRQGLFDALDEAYASAAA